MRAPVEEECGDKSEDVLGVLEFGGFSIAYPS
jgi:hypothetical protein